MEQGDLIPGSGSLAENVRALRGQRGMSLTRMAEVTGVSKSMLRQIELGQSSPSVATLWKIANGLRLPITYLLRPRRAEMVIGSFRDQPFMSNEDGRYRVYPLVPYDPERAFEIYYVEMEPHVSLDAEPHEGRAEEHLMIQTGAIEVTASERTERVEAGQYISFAASVPHAYRNVGEGPVEMIMVISYLP